MKKLLRLFPADALQRLTLDAQTAVDLMTPRVLAVSANMTVKEAAAFLTHKGINAAPVVDEGGQAVGVLSRADIVRYDYEKVENVRDGPEWEPEATPPVGHSRFARLRSQAGERLPSSFHVEAPDGTPVRDIMTPIVFKVAPETPARLVVEAMLSLRVHRLFVIDDDGDIVGVVSALDVLRHLCQ